MAPEKPEEHDALEQQIENDLRDPSKDQKEIEARIAELQGSKHLVAGSNVADWTQLRDKAAKRNEEIKDLEKARALTSDADFKKIEEDMKKGDGTTGSTKIVEMLGKIVELSDNTAVRPHNAVLQTQVFNDVITKIQSLATDNKIILVPGGVVGVKDDTILQTAKDEKPKTFKSGGKIATAVENFNKPGQAAQTKEVAKQALVDAVKERKDELWPEIHIIAKQPSIVDSQKIVQEYLNQIKELVDLQNNLINGVSAAAPVASPSVVAGEAASNAPEASVDADKFFKDKGIDGKLIEGLTTAKDLDAQNKALEALNSDSKVAALLKVPADAKAFADALNTKLTGSSPKLTVDVKDAKLVAKTESVVAAEAASKGPDEIKDFQSFLRECFAEFMKFLKEMRMSPEGLRTGGDPDKLNASNASTQTVVGAEAAARLQATNTQKALDEARAREARAAASEKPKCKKECDSYEKQLNDLKKRVARLEGERKKCETIDTNFERRVDALRREADRRRVPVHFCPDSTKRYVRCEPKAGASPERFTSFMDGVKTEVRAVRGTVVQDKDGFLLNLNYVPSTTVAKEAAAKRPSTVSAEAARKSPAPRRGRIVSDSPATGSLS